MENLIVIYVEKKTKINYCQSIFNILNYYIFFFRVRIITSTKFAEVCVDIIKLKIPIDLVLKLFGNSLKYRV